MGRRRSFKSDESFLEKISIGAVGTRRVYDDLLAQGHVPIELERGSMSFKIWKTIKIKRIRVPDILCLDIGLRIESRAKTKLEISMSHSFSDPERGWDYGLEDDDLVALAVCNRTGDKPIDWQADSLVQYIRVRDMRAAQRNGLVLGVDPKGAQEGFEARLTWPAAIANAEGTITEISDNYIKYRRALDNRTITLRRIRGEIALNPLVIEGDQVRENQILASVMPISVSIPDDIEVVSANDYISRLESYSLSERYTAAKALSYLGAENVVEALLERMNDVQDHIYVRLESAAGLSRLANERGNLFLLNTLSDEYLENRLEAVIVLGEIGTPFAANMLVQTLRDEEQHSEIRAGAAWALGELRNHSALNALIDSFTEVDESIRIEATRALAKLARQYSEQVIDEFVHSNTETRPGIAWAISSASRFTLDQLLGSLVNDDARRWIAYVLGSQDPARYIGEIEALKSKDPEVYFAVTVLWQIMNSWVYGLEEYG